MLTLKIIRINVLLSLSRWKRLVRMTDLSTNSSIDRALDGHGACCSCDKPAQEGLARVL